MCGITDNVTKLNYFRSNHFTLELSIFTVSMKLEIHCVLLNWWRVLCVSYRGVTDPSDLQKLFSSLKTLCLPVIPDCSQFLSFLPHFGIFSSVSSSLHIDHLHESSEEWESCHHIQLLLSCSFKALSKKTNKKKPFGGLSGENRCLLLASNWNSNWQLLAEFFDNL